jgi:UDP-N-acetylmuramoyl-tripeptide--D-alanyl-D-alanine ligase
MLTIEEILNATRGQLISGKKITRPLAVSTDSRTIKKGSLFIPLIGSRYDGHKFIVPALKKGASAVLTSKNIKVPKDKTVILVKDTLKAFHQIAKYHKEKFKIPLIGITGSSGKTTTKDMLASILSLAGRTLKTEENYNNEVGVPKTLLTLNKTYKYSVIEMAMQGHGEIEELARIALPNIAVITNIGSAHMEHLRSEDNIAKAKSEILKFQTIKNIAVLPADDKYFSYLKKKAKGKVLSFGIDSSADVAAKNIRFRAESSSFVIEIKKFQIAVNLPLPGKHNIYDALAAAASAYVVGISPDRIKNGLQKLKLSSKRLNIIHFKDINIIDDTYNANPDSMAASLSILENYPGRRIAVLGDMLELGRIARKSHENIGRLAANLNIETLITVGELSKHAAKSARSGGLKNVYSTKINIEAVKVLKKMIRPNDTILVKGSRGMHMEHIVEGLIKHAQD